MQRLEQEQVNANEPVAWMDDFGNVFEMQNQFFYIPLYTHPAKPLSNVVVASATCSCGKVMEVTNLQEAKTLTDEEIDSIGDEVSNLIDTYAGRREFARAILRKAQEK